MKKWFAVLLGALLICSLVACGGDKDAEVTTGDTDVTTSETVTTLSALRLGAGYTLVRQAGNVAAVNDAALDAKTTLDKATGLNFKMVIASDTNVQDKEILIGDTGRAESVKWAEGLTYNDYVIAADGNKLVIVGGSAEATVKAVTYFMNKYVAKDMSFEQGEIYVYRMEYAVKGITVDGVDISEYQIVVGGTTELEKKNYEAVADAINQKLIGIYGKKLSVVDASAAVKSHEFILGTCGGARSSYFASSTELSATSYTATVKDGTIVFLAGSQFAGVKAMNAMLDVYLPEGLSGTVALRLKNGTESGEVSPSEFELAEGATMRVMSNNMLFGNNTKEDRSSLLIEQYLRYYPDVIGLQECDSLNHTRVINQLTDFYGIAGGKIGSKQSYTPILYRLDRYEEVASGCEYFAKRFTDTKMFSWAVLRDKQTGKLVIMANGHYAIILSSYDTTYKNSVEGEEWRADNVRQVKARVAALLEKYGEDAAVFICGDFNTGNTSRAYKDLSEVYTDAYKAATVSKTAGATYHQGVGSSVNRNGSAIDFIFVNSTVSVLTHAIPGDKLTIDSSDHAPVIIDVSLK